MKPEQPFEPLSDTSQGSTARYGSELDGSASTVIDAAGADYEVPAPTHLSRWTSAYHNHSQLLKLTIVVLIFLLLGTATGLVLVARHIAGSRILGTSGNNLNLQSSQMNVTNNYSLTVNGQLRVTGPANLQSLQVATNANVQGDLTVGGTVRASNFAGNGANLTNVNASALNGQPGSYYTNAGNLSSGTLSDSRLSPNVTLMGNSFNGPSQLLQLLTSGALPALDGSNLSNVNAAALQGYAASYFMDAGNLSSGTLSDARLSADVPLLYTNNTFTGSNSFQDVSATSILQNGYQVCDTSGNCGGGSSGVSASGATAGSLAMFTSANTIANSIITQSGTTVTVSGTLAATALQGDGSGVTNVDAATLNGQPGSYYTNASNLNAGTVPTAQLSGNYNGITGTGDLTSGSISSGFGVISTTNTIATSGQLQGNTLSAAGGAFAVSGTGGITATGLATSGTVTLSALGAGIVQSDASGNLSSGSLDRNSALLTGQTSVVNGGTGATDATGARTNLGAAASGANSDITSLGAVTSVGSTGQALTLQGNASTVLSATDSGFTTSVGFATPTANVNYLFDTSASNGTYTICTTAGNCAGAGSGVTVSSPGTANTIAMFTGAGSIANSLLSQAGTTVSVAGTLAATALQGDGSGLTNLDGTNISSGTVGVSVGGTGVSSFTQYGVVYGNGTNALQVTAAGTTGDCLVATSGAAPTWQSCASASSGATPGGPAGGDLSGTYPNPQVSGLSGTPLSISSLTSGNVLVYNGTDWVNVSVSGDLSVDGAGVATIANGAVTGAKIAAGTITGGNIASGTVANSNLVSSQITITPGTGLNGGGAVSLGGSTTLSVLYGSAAGTAVEGNTTLTCAAGSGNLTGGGNTITLGAGGTCGALGVVASPTFSGLTLSSLGSGIMQTDSLGNVSSTTIDRNSALLTGQTSVANGGTGATTAAGARTNLGAAAAGANSDITSLSATTSVGSTGSALTLQGNASTVLTASDSGFTTSVGFATPTANVNYLFGTAAAGTYTICTTVGNCAGAGAGVTVSSSGTNGTIAMFTGSQTIANSILSQSGTTVTVAGTLAATALQGDGAAITNLNGTNIASGTVGVSVGGTGTNAVGAAGSLAYSNGSSYAFTGVGSAGECLVSNASSAPTWTSCSGAAGSLAGDVTGPLNANTLSAIQGATLSVTSLATSNMLIYNGTDWVNASLSGDLTVSGAGVATIANGAVTGAKIASATITGANIAANTVANSNLVSSSITITAGSGLNGGGAVSLGGSTSLNVVYGSTAGTAVAGNTSLICPAAGTNLSGGGNTITLGAGGTCGALSVVGSPTFSGLTLSGFSAGIVQTDGTGAVSSTTVDRNSALLTGQTSIANGGTGATTAAGARTNLGAAAAGANSDITSLSAATSVGATTAALTLQGNASTTLTSTNSGFTTTVGFSGTPTGAVIYHFDASATPGTYTICTTIGNCAGAGGGVTTSSSGTNGTIAMFTGSSTIANSILTQSGTTVTVAGTLAATDLQGSGSGITNLNASNIASGMLSPSYGGTGSNGLTQYGVVLGGGTGNALTATAAGATGDCLVANTGAAPTWMSCSSAGSGGTPGGPAGGDLSGTYPNPEVVGMYNVPLSITSLTSGNFLQYNGTNWVNNSFSGDLTVSNTGVATIANGAVTGTKIANNTITNTQLQANGQFTNIAGVGTLTAGTWNATAIGVAYGGTGLTAAPSSGQIMIGNSSGGYTLATITPSTNIAVSSTSGSITIGLTGTVGVANGGTGATSVGAAGSVAYSNGTNYAFSAAGTSGQCLTSGGTAAPTWATCAAGSGGSGYIQNQSAAAQSANYYIQSAATNTVTATLEALSGQTADLLQFQTSTGAPVGGVNNAGQLYYTNSGHTVTLQSATLSANQAITMPNASGTMITTGNLTNITATGTISAGTWNGSTVGVSYGGTGATSLTQYGVLYGNGTGSILATPVGTTGQCLIGNTGAAPSWQSCGSAAGSLAGDVTGALASNTLSKIQGTTLSIASLTSANFLQYNGTNWVNQSISGDATVSSSGVLTVANGAITGAKIANTTITGSNIAANTVANGNLVNSGITVVNGTNVTGGAVVNLGGSITLSVINNPTFSGLVTASGGLTATSLTDTGLTTAGIVTNTAGGALGTVATVPVANGGTGVGSVGAAGTVAYSNGTAFAFSAAGTSGQCLTSSGTSAPTWTTCTGAGSGNTLQTAYSNSVGGTTPEIVLDSTRTSVDIQAYSGQTADLLDLRAYNNTGLGTVLFGVSNTGALAMAGQLTVQSGGAAITGNSSITGTLTGLTGLTSSGSIQFTGLSTGVVLSSSGTLSSGTVNLASSSYVSGTLGVANGGTGLTSAGTAGTLLYSNGSSFLNSAAGTAGQCLVSGGSSAPTWGSCAGATGGTGYIQNGTATQTNANFNIQTAATSSVTAAIKALTSQTADLLQFQNSGGTPTSGVDASGNWYYSNSGYKVSLASASLSANQTVTIPNATGTIITTGNLTGITATGTIASGVWNGSTVGVPYGGTGATSLTLNGVLYGNGTGTIGATAAGTTGQCLLATTGAAPSWGSCTSASSVSTSSNGTANTIAMFTGSSTIANSLLTQDAGATTVTDGGNLTVSGTTTLNGNTTIASSKTLTLSGLASGIVTSTSGTLGVTSSVPVANGGTGLTATPTNGQLLIGNGTGYTLGTLSGTGITITNGGGTIGLSTIYGSAASTAVQGNTTLTCSSTSGNLSGGGNVITLGSGGTCSPITLTATPTFTTATLTGNNALTLGTANSFNGAIILKNATNANTVTLTTAAQTGSYSLTIPALTGADTICLQTLGNCTASASSFIQNQNSAQQATSNFWISGTGRADTSFLTPLLDTPTAVALNIGTTNATQINLNQNVVVAAGKSISLTGGNTASRPLTPTAGQLYYDTTTNSLLTYNGSKWMSDKSTPNKIVAMGTATGCTGTSPVASSNSDGADFVDTSCNSAQTTINNAIAALPSSGGTVYLEDGTYIINGQINVPNNVTLAGDGAATVIKLADGIASAIHALNVTGSRATVQNLELDGNKANNATINNYGIFVTSGSGSGSSAVPGAVINSIDVENFTYMGLYATSGANDKVTNSTFLANGNVGGSWYASNSLFSNDTFQGNGSTGLSIGSGGNTITGSYFQGNGGDGAYFANTAGTFTGNTVTGNTADGVMAYGKVAVSGNTVSSNGGVGISVNSGSGTVVSGNTVMSNTGDGIYLQTSANSLITGNTVVSNGGNGIRAWNGDNYSQITNNLLQNNTGTGSNNSIISSVSSNVYIANNTITDNGGTGYAIYIGDTSDVLSGNTYSGTGATTIYDTGTGTIWQGQVDANGNIINKNMGALTVGTSTVNGTLSVQGGITTAQLPTPATPTISKVGTAGTSSYSYSVTALDGTGETLASTAGTITTGYTPLSGTNYNTVTWKDVSGATSYKIYRTAVSGGGSPATTGLIGTVTSTAGSTQTFNDTGLAASVAVPAVNTTGGATIAGQVQGSSAVFSSASSLTVGKASTATGSVSFANASNANLVTLTTAVQTGSYSLTIPALTANDTICTVNTGCGTPVGAAGGDLSGTYPNPTVSGLSGKALSITSLAANQTLVYNGTNWVNSLLGNSNLTSGAYGNILGTGALVSGSIASGFGAINTTNAITTTAAVQGGTLTAATGAVTSGNATTAGSLVVNDGSGHTVTIATVGALTASTTLTLPNASGTICLQSATTCGFESTSGTDFIQNQNASAQTANFNISGNGTVGGTVYSSNLDTAAASGTLTLGGTNATTIHVGTNASNATSVVAGSSNAGTTVKLQGGSTYLDVTNAGIGINTTTPASTLDLGAGASSSLYNGVRTYNNVYSGYTASASQTGTLEIVMPNAWTNTMLRFDITGYDFASTTGAWRATISGYNYSTTSSWYDVSASIEGTAPFTQIRFGYDTVLGKAVLLLGNTSTVWHYPQFTIAQVEAGLSNVGLWGSGYSSAFLSSESNIGTISSPTTTAVAYTNQTFLQGGNSFGTAAVLGTNDANSLLFRTGGTTRLTIDTSGNATLTGALTVQGTGPSTFAGALRAVSFDANTAAALSIGGTNATSINIGKTTSNITTTIYGTTVVKPTTGNDSTTAFQVQNASGTIALLNEDTVNGTLTVRALSDTTNIGANLYSDPSGFASNWTTTGWTISGTAPSDKATHNAGSTSPLTYNGFSPTAGHKYLVQFYNGYGGCPLTSPDALTVTLGGATAATVNDKDCNYGTLAYTVTATTTAGLSFTPTTNSTAVIWDSNNGSTSSFAIYDITNVTAYAPVLSVLNASGATNFEVRASNDTNSTYLGTGSGSMSNGSLANNNTGVGTNALKNNLSGYNNTAVGAAALQNNTIGWSNVALGDLGLYSNTTGTYNIGIGDYALGGNTTGSGNIGIGANTLSDSNIASNNTVIGNNAGFCDVKNSCTVHDLQNASAFGAYAQVTQSNSMVLGSVDMLTSVGIGITSPTNFLSVSPVDLNSPTITATQSSGSATITASSAIFSAANVGEILVWSDGKTETITGYTDSTHVTGSSTTLAETNNNFRTHHTGLQVTSAGNVGIGTITPGYPLDVLGDINTSTQYRIGGTVICTASGCTPAAGSANYIQNQTATTQVAGFKINGTGTAAVLQAGSLDTSAAGTLSLGTTTANAISLGSAGVTTTTAGSFDIKQNLTLDGTYTTANNTRMYYSGTLNSSSTTYQYGIQNSAAFTPTGASLLGIYGMSNLPNISGSALNINNVVGTISGVTTSAGYTGTITNGIAIQAQDANISGSNKFGSYTEFAGSVVANNGGNTSGTINNYGVHLLGMTTGAGTGGTLNNYAINLTMPTGTGGTTNNYGLYIQGNGNGASGNNYSLYNASTATSYFAGDIQAASTITINGSPTVGALNVAGTGTQTGTGTVSGTNGTAIVNGVGTAFTTQLALGDTITISGSNYSVSSITSDTRLTVNSNLNNTFSNVSYSYTPPAVNVTASTNGSGLAILGSNGDEAITVYNAGGAQSFHVSSGGYLWANAGANINQSVNLAVFGSGYTVTLGNVNNPTVVGGTLTVSGLVTATTSLVVGSGANTITLSPTSGYMATGTARHSKTITLTPEYAGAVLDSASDSACSANYNGTMTSAYDSAARYNSYLWTSSNATSQCYDVVVQVPIPSDFNGWSANPQIMAKGSSATNTSYGISIQDGSGSYESGYGSGYATGSPTTSWANIAASGLTGNYSPNGVMTIRIRMGAQNSANMYLGNIVLTYYSSF